MSAAHAFVAGRGAVPIAEVATWLCRTRRFVYTLIGRGQLDKFTSGRVTADSVVRYYETFNGGGAADEVKQSTSTAPVPVAGINNSGKRHKELRAVTGGAISVGGGAQ